MDKLNYVTLLIYFLVTVVDTKFENYHSNGV